MKLKLFAIAAALIASSTAVLAQSSLDKVKVVQEYLNTLSDIATIGDLTGTKNPIFVVSITKDRVVTLTLDPKDNPELISALNQVRSQRLGEAALLKQNIDYMRDHQPVTDVRDMTLLEAGAK